MDKRKYGAVALLALLLLSLWGCQKESAAATQKESTSATAKIPVHDEDPVPKIVIGENGLEYLWDDSLGGYLLVSKGSCKDAAPVIPDRIDGEKVVAIGTDAFADATHLTVLTLPDSITVIGGGAFRGCVNLTTIQLGQFVESIDRHAFQNCSSLEQFTMPHSVMSLGMGAFAGCASLKSIAFSDHIPEISRGAFENCTSLVTLSIPSWATYIAPDAFAGCSSLAGLTVPSWVNQIGAGAFSGCTALKKVVFEAPDGWSVTPSEGEQEITLNLSDSTANVAFLTVDYAGSDWVKK